MKKNKKKSENLPSILKNRTKDDEKRVKSHRFPLYVTCPRCGAKSTRTSQHKDTQYRQCSSAVCRKKFTVNAIIENTIDK